MNKERRKKLESIAGELYMLKDKLEEVMEDERDAFDSLPESLQESERGQDMEQNADDLEEQVGNLDDIIDAINDVIDR